MPEDGTMANLKKLNFEADLCKGKLRSRCRLERKQKKRPQYSTEAFSKGLAYKLKLVPQQGFEPRTY